MSDLYDLTGLEPSAAREHLLRIGTQLKLDQNRLAELQAEIKTWQDRVTLATEKGAAELATQAQAKVDELSGKKVVLEADIIDLEMGLKKMQDQLRSPAFAAAPSVNAAALLDSLEAMAGKTDQVSPALKSFEADDALAALKAKMAAENGPKP